MSAVSTRWAVSLLPALTRHQLSWGGGGLIKAAVWSLPVLKLGHTWEFTHLLPGSAVVSRLGNTHTHSHCCQKHLTQVANTPHVPLVSHRCTLTADGE